MKLSMAFSLVFGVLATFLFLILWWASHRTISPYDYDAGVVAGTPIPVTTRAKHLTLMTYNIGFAGGLEGLDGQVPSASKTRTNLDAMISTIKAQNPDILAVQEIDLDSRRSTYINEVEYIAQKAGYPYFAVAFTWDCRWVPHPMGFQFRKQFGKVLAAQAIFSKYPILSQSQLRFKKPRKNFWIYNLFYLERVAQTVQIDVGAPDPITVVNVHLEAWHPEERAIQTKAIRDQLAKNGTESTFLMGDFNAIPASATQRNGFIDDPKDDYRGDESLHPITTLLSEILPSPGHFTYPANQPTRRLDYIFYGTEFKLVDGRVVSSAVGSDHLPVVGEFTLP